MRSRSVHLSHCTLYIEQLRLNRFELDIARLRNIDLHITFLRFCQILRTNLQKNNREWDSGHGLVKNRNGSSTRNLNYLSLLATEITA